jgi:glycosyltransferase involved in cell wall biosynthesis
LFWDFEGVPPIIRRNAHLFDEIWTASRFSETALRKSLNLKVRYVPIPLWQEPPRVNVTRSDLGLPERPFMFLFTWDYSSSVERKNPFAVLSAYEAAFHPSEGAILVLKSINASGASDQHKRLLARCEGRADIFVLDKYLTREQMDGLPGICDAYVSLHRSEGLGLTMVEAMRHGKPVIATNYGGNVDFITTENGIPAPWSYVPLSDGVVTAYGNIKCSWAEPDASAAAIAMRRLFENPILCRKLGEAGQNTLCRDHSLSAIAPFWKKAYEEAVQDRGRLRSRIVPVILTQLGRLYRWRKAQSISG